MLVSKRTALQLVKVIKYLMSYENIFYLRFHTEGGQVRHEGVSNPASWASPIKQRMRFSKSQHIHLKDKFTETALNKVISTIERSLHCKHYTLAGFLNIERIIDNVSTYAIKEALTRIELDEYLSH